MSKGGGGSGGGSQTTSLTPWGPETKYLQELFGMGNNLLRGRHTNIGAYPGPQQQVAGFTPEELAGIQNELSMIPGMTDLASTGMRSLGDTLGGRYLNPSSNPELAAYAHAATEGMVNEYQTATGPSEMAQAALSGAFGGSADAENRALNQYKLANAIGNTEANIYEPAYESERQNMMRAQALLPETLQAGAIPGETQLRVGGLEQEQHQQELNAAYQNQYQSAMWPWEALGLFQNTLGAGSGLGTSTTNNSLMSDGKSTMQSVMGGLETAASIASMFI